MSQENVEIVRRQFEAWTEGDFEKWSEDWDPDVVVIAPEGWPDGEVNRGIDEWRRQAERLRETWAQARVEIDELRPVENGVLARIRYVTVSADTDLPFETPLAALFFLKQGRITLGQYFWNVGE